MGDPAYRGGCGLGGGRLRRGAAGSEIQPYLEGGIEEAALSGGRHGGGAWVGDAGSGDPAYRGGAGRCLRRGGGWLGDPALP